MKLLHTYSEQIAILCAAYNVVELSAFGSIVRNELTAESDIDLLATFGEVELDEYADNYFDFCDALEKLFDRKVDLVVEKAVKNPYFREELEETKKLLFAA